MGEMAGVEKREVSDEVALACELEDLEIRWRKGGKKKTIWDYRISSNQNVVAT